MKDFPFNSLAALRAAIPPDEGGYCRTGPLLSFYLVARAAVVPGRGEEPGEPLVEKGRRLSISGIGHLDVKLHRKFGCPVPGLSRHHSGVHSLVNQRRNRGVAQPAGDPSMPVDRHESGTICA